MGNASITKRALVYLRKKFLEHPEWGAMLIVTVHDEIEIEVKEEYLNVCAEEVKKQMERAGKYYIKSVPIVIDIDKGKYWIH